MRKIIITDVDLMSQEQEDCLKRMLNGFVDFEEVNGFDEIEIKWHIDDVKSLNDNLTDDQCRQVLQHIDLNHDASVGIYWDVIREAISDLRTNGFTKYEI